MGEQVRGDMNDFEFGDSLFYKFKGTALKLLRPINPFAVYASSNEQHVGFAPRNGTHYYRPEPYPNSVVFSRLFAPHFDPNGDGPRPGWDLMHYQVSPLSGDYTLEVTGSSLPRACQRYYDIYNRCKMVNGTEKCQREVKDVMEICPPFSLEMLKDHKRQQKKFLKIQDQQYREAMNVSSYNVGRTVADVSSKTYVHGTSKYLRPDTMWNDDRYLTVTQDEIDAAKVRYNERLRAEGKRLNEPLQQVDTHVDSEYAYTGLEKRHIYAQPIEKH